MQESNLSDILRQATVHVLGCDHDNCTEVASNKENKDKLYDFLIKEVLQCVESADKKPTIIVGNDSLRQDAYLDLLNIVSNAYVEENVVHLNGSVFSNLEWIVGELASRLGDKVKSVELCKIMTPDILGKAKITYYDAYKLSANQYYKYLENLSTSIWKKIKDGTIEINKENPSICYDSSKFLNIWLKIQAIASDRPKENIVYHFLDDCLDYGESLLDLFEQHPALLPSNVTFAFHHLDYSDHFLECDGEIPTAYYCNDDDVSFVAGEGEIHRNYKKLAKRFASMMSDTNPENPGEFVLKPGKEFDGVLDIQDYEYIDILGKLFNEMTTTPEKETSTNTSIIAFKFFKDVIVTSPPSSPTKHKNDERFALRNVNKNG